jgi:hypothetical protein
MVLRVGAVLRGWHPSIIQTHGYKATAVAYVLRRLRSSWPWMGFFHGTTTEDVKDRLYHRVDRRLLSAADRIVVMSRAQTQAFRHCGDRVRIIYNAALDTPPAGDPAERDRLTALASSLPRPIVGVVGRLSLEKGVDLFLDACAVLAQRGLVFSALTVFRWGRLAILALAIQLVLFSPLAAGLGEASRWIYVGSTALVVIVVLANLRLAGLPIVLVGAVSNLVAILANGGSMPASPDALARIGAALHSGPTNSVVVDHPALEPLTDIFAMPAWIPFANVFSIGDVLIGLGVAVAIAAAMRSNVRRA